MAEEASVSAGVPAPRARQRVIIPNALPLGEVQKSHNWWNAPNGVEPDIRFAPLIIIVKPDWLRICPGYIQTRVEEWLTWDVDTKFKPHQFHTMVNALINEEIMMRALGKQFLNHDLVFGTIAAFILEHWDEHANGCQKSMMTATYDANDEFDGFDIDWTKASGPYYCDGAVAIEHHYAQHVRGWTPRGN